MQLSLGVESVEVILESESTQSSRGYPVLAFNINAVAQVFEWTGDVSVGGREEGGRKIEREEVRLGREEGWSRVGGRKEG